MFITIFTKDLKRYRDSNLGVLAQPSLTSFLPTFTHYLAIFIHFIPKQAQNISVWGETLAQFGGNNIWGTKYGHLRRISDTPFSQNDMGKTRTPILLSFFETKGTEYGRLWRHHI
jgi:hypothetical protein